MRDPAQTFEPLLLRAWPALETVFRDGWLLRAALGYTGRANSVHILDPPVLRLDDKLAHADRWYRERGLPLQFRLHDSGPSLDLDRALGGMFGRRSDTFVLHREIDHAAVPAIGDVVAETTAQPEWIDAKRRYGGFRSGVAGRWEQIIAAIDGEVLFCSVGESGNGLPAAVGILVVDGDWACVLDVLVDPSRRRAGYGRRLVVDMMQRASAAGATGVHLQVEESNQAALGLYRDLGFETAYRYWYRFRR